MKSILLLAGFALLITYSPPLVAQSPSDRSPVSQDERKTKTKDGKTTTREKSKPVRKAIEDWYARNMAAFKAKDLAAIMALRAEDFHTITPDGKVNTRADMATRTRLF